MSGKNEILAKYLADYLGREAEKEGSAMTDEGVRAAIIAEGIEAYESVHNCAVGEITSAVSALHCASGLVLGSFAKYGKTYIPDNQFGIKEGYRTDKQMSGMLYFLGDMLD